MLLDREFELEELRSVNARPAQGTFTLPHPALIRPGDPYASVLYYRLAKTGRGHMPHIGSQTVDWEGVKLIHDWITSLPCDEPNNGRLQARAEALARQLSSDAGGASSDVALSDELSNPYLALAVQRRAAEYAVMPMRPEWWTAIEAAGRGSNPIIRDLFEQFLPESERVERLGNRVDAAAILAMTGDAERGRALFTRSQTLACRNCHRVGEAGTAVGPDLTAIGKLRPRAELLESILDPSKQIDPKFVTYVVETQTGVVHTGLLVSRDDEGLTLRTAENKTLSINADEIEQAVPQQRSLMPDLLFRDLTAKELADLLAFLESLR